MSPTATNNNRHSGDLRELQRLLRNIARLPKTNIDRLLNVLSDLEAATDDNQREEIARTIVELVYPKLLLPHRLPAKSLATIASGREGLMRWRQCVGQKIRQRRLELKLTQAELADRAGLRQTHVSRLELGVHVPTELTIVRLAEALKVEPCELDPGFGETRDPGQDKGGK